MESKSILLVVASILLSGLMISSAIIYNGQKGSTTQTATTLEQGSEDPIEARGITMDLSEDTPYLGEKAEGKIVIVEFSDYECPFCKRFHTQARADIIKSYVDTGKAILAWKDYPLSFHDPLATKQAVAAQCVYRQAGNKGYFAYSSKIFEVTTSGGDGMKEAQLEELASGIEGVNIDTFRSCYSNQETKATVQAGIDLGNENGINGTPGFIIGRLKDGKIIDGVRVAGALPFTSFETILNEVSQ